MPKNQEHWYLRAEEDKCLSSSRKSEFALSPPFCSMQALNRVDDAHLLMWGWSLHNLLIQILISSIQALTDTPINNVLPIIWASLDPAKFTHKLSHQYHVRKMHSRIHCVVFKDGLVVPVLRPGLSKQQNNPHEGRAQGAWHISAYPSFISNKSLWVYHHYPLSKGVSAWFYTWAVKEIFENCVVKNSTAHCASFLLTTRKMLSVWQNYHLSMTGHRTFWKYLVLFSTWT